MEPSSREDLSALMDGELAAEPTRFLLRRLDHDPELAATWSRWHLVRACLADDPARRMTGQQRDDDFAARVAATVRAESASAPRRHRWARYVGGGAIAASVAVAALMLNAPEHVPDTATPASLASGTSAPSPAAPALADAAPRQPAELTPPWLLARQPTVLGAQPASANVVYGTGLLQPDYLHRATYSRDGVSALRFGAGARGANAPGFSVMLVPESPPASSVASGVPPRR